MSSFSNMPRRLTQWSAVANFTKDMNFLDRNEAPLLSEVVLSTSHEWPCKFTT